jgi:hypothetical protein
MSAEGAVDGPAGAEDLEGGEGEAGGFVFEVDVGEAEGGGEGVEGVEGGSVVGWEGSVEGEDGGGGGGGGVREGLAVVGVLEEWGASECLVGGEVADWVGFHFIEDTVAL